MSKADHGGGTRPAAFDPRDWIVLRGVREHNLRIEELAVPRHGVTVFTGVSGSGKSSLAFDTIYAEGYRQYLDSLSAYVRRKLPKVPKPAVEWISGLSPTVAIEQRTISRNPRSNVGTITEISDRLRLLYARAGRHECRGCGQDVHPRDVAEHLRALAVAAAAGPLELVRPAAEAADELTAERVLLLPACPNDEELARARQVIEAAHREGSRLVALRDGRQIRHLTGGWICPACGTEVRATSSQWFTPNSPAGMCEDCQGLGFTYRVDPGLLVGDPEASVRSGALTFFGDRTRSKKTWWPLRELPTVLERAGAGLDTPWHLLPEGVRELVLSGSTERPLPEPLTRELAAKPFDGLTQHLERLFREADSPERKSFYQAFMSAHGCTGCGGTRHHPEALAVRLADLNIAEVNALPVARLVEWLAAVRAELAPTFLADLAEELLAQIGTRLTFMLDVGLGYLSLDRAAPTLSAGEGQRLRLARQLGCGLVGVTYVLDEPSIGLHARDNARLIALLRQLADAGNTVLVVEHDQETMESADHLVDLGPGAGTRGGTVIAAGPTAEVIGHPSSRTAAYLRGEQVVGSPRAARRQPGDAWLTIRGAHLHNLRGVDAALPAGLLTCVTGVSGSGKSSLITRTLQPALERALSRRHAPTGPFTELTGWEQFSRVATVTQESIGASSRSTPATYVGVFDEIRKLFAKTDEAVRRRWSTAMFSFNTDRGGRCDRCAGKGTIRVEMLFLADFSMRCPSCDGLRYHPRVLEVTCRGRNISETLDLEVAEALEVFRDVPVIAHSLGMLCQVGLGYLRLGQDTTTLSGGEAQRLKLARELMGRGDGRTLYLIDEPTTGLHFSDVEVLLGVVHDLVDLGNTVVVIEHSVEFAASCDWIVDLGPGGGEHGGELVAAGPPDEVAAHPKSALAPYLDRQLHVMSSRGGHHAETER
ncbi:excinuclease ABC subunit UvrA [Streptomyces sp. JJ66]|uniref:excinuclease ABC subunit UvrA n=1 Tax=Streptomyces sp. JJ66 TaxID=2803843 RepID=UPI001C55F821|nr:excinuclease ABC subunit UvrA [Streptomyces sp. JJ66]MBW1600729.1 excinuclease ABC subunit UvrA [Streptomyces sp. JJ66]